jgi:predicted nucleic acid-binding Zn ribbon protein
MSPRERSVPRRVGDLLAAAVPGLGERLLGARIAAEWPRVAGAELARRARPGELRAGVLEVRADNSPWLQEVAFRQGEVLARLQARYGPEVAALRIVLASPHPEPGRPA